MSGALCKERRLGQRQHTSTQGEGVQLPAQERDLRGTYPAGTLTLGFQPPEL